MVLYINRTSTDDSNSAETRLKVFHSRRSESMSAPHESLNRTSAGDELSGVHSSGDGRTGSVCGCTVIGIGLDSGLLPRRRGRGAQICIIRSISGWLISASSNRCAMREK